MRAPAPRSLKARALTALAQREQSRAELRRKLLPHARAEEVALQEATESAATIGTGAAEGASASAHCAVGADHMPSTATPDGADVTDESHCADSAGFADRHASHDSRPLSALPAERAFVAANRATTLAGPDPAAVVQPLTAEQRVDAVLDWLEGHGYLSNERFAEARAHARSSKFGNVRIREELRQHHIALSPAAVESLAASEAARAAAVLERKFPKAPGRAPERARQFRFLSARGFSATSIQAALREHPRDRTTEFAGDEPVVDDDDG